MTESLAIQDYPTVLRAHDHAHPLPCAVEPKCLQQCVPLTLSHHLDIDHILGFAHEREADVPRSNHERSLIWRLCLVLQAPRLLGLPRLVCDSDGVANGQRAEKGGCCPICSDVRPVMSLVSLGMTSASLSICAYRFLKSLARVGTMMSLSTARLHTNSSGSTASAQPSLVTAPCCTSESVIHGWNTFGTP